MRRQTQFAIGLSAVLMAVLAPRGDARVIEIPAAFRVGPPQGSTGNGLTMRFKDLASGCGIALCKAAADTVNLQVTTFANVNFLLNQGTTIGGFNHGGGYFATRWDSYLDIRVPGDYVFAMQVDDNAEVAIGDSVVLRLDGGNWFGNAKSDTVRFAYAGSYPLRAYYADCQPCCRGFRLGGMGPVGSGFMAFNAAFDFNADLGPCCTTGTNGPGVSLVPGALFFRSPPTVSVDPVPAAGASGSIRSCWAGPNPARGAVLLALELSRAQRVWAEVYDAAGRHVATQVAGELTPAGVVRWPWVRPASNASGTYFFRVRTEDGSTATVRVAVIR